MAKKTNKFTQKPNDNPMKTLLIGTLFGVCSSVLVFTALLFIFSAFALNNSDPSSLYFVFGILTSLISVFVGGFVSSKLSSGYEIMSSALCGCVLAVIAFVLGIFCVGSNSDGLSSFVFLVFPALCILGGLIGKPKKSKRKNFSKR